MTSDTSGDPRYGRWAGVTLADIMSPKLVAIPLSATARDIEQILVDGNVSGAPVSDAQGRTVGVVSWRDVMEYFAHSPDREPHRPHVFYRHVDDESLEYREEVEVPVDDRITAQDLMNTDLLTVSSTAGLAEAARAMCEHEVHRLLVTDQATGDVVGIVSTMDILKVLAE